MYHGALRTHILGRPGIRDVDYTILVGGAGKYAHVFPRHFLRSVAAEEMLSRKCWPRWGTAEERRLGFAESAGEGDGAVYIIDTAVVEKPIV